MPRPRKPVGSYDADGNLVKIYPSVSSVIEDGMWPSNISDGIRQRAPRYGYYWNYIREEDRYGNMPALPRSLPDNLILGDARGSFEYSAERELDAIEAALSVLASVDNGGVARCEQRI